MEHIKEWNALTGQLNHDKVTGHIKGILFTFRGTAEAAKNAAISDITEIRIDWIKRKGAVTLSMQRLAQIGTLKGGRLGDRANTGGAFLFQAYYPCGLWGDDNAYFLTPKDDFNITVKFGANVTSTNYLTAILDIHLDEGEGQFKYFLGLEQQTIGDLTINANAFPKDFSKENIVAVYVTPSTDIDALGVQRGGRHYHMTFEEWRNITHYRNAIESNAQETAFSATLNFPDMAELWLAGHGSYSETLEDDVRLIFDTGSSAPTPDVIFLTLDFTPDKLDESNVAIAAKLESRLATKTTVGHSRAIQVIDRLRAGI